MGKDIVGLVKALGHSDCIAIAHDWGALQCWHHALLYPEVLKALFIVSIPCCETPHSHVPHPPHRTCVLGAGEGCPRVSDASTMDPLAFARQIYPKDEQFWYLRYHNYDYLAEIGRAEDVYDADPGLMFRCEHSKVALASHQC